MAAILQPAWLAISLFAVQVSAFVPFGRVHVPHVKVRPAVSVAPGGRGHSARGWAGAPAAQGQRRARLPLMMGPMTQVAPPRPVTQADHPRDQMAARVVDPLAWLYYDPQLAKSPMPLRIPFSASRIVADWIADAREEMTSFKVGEGTSILKATSRRRSLANYRASLEGFETFITTRDFERVLALTAKWYGGKNIIQALAVVTPVLLQDGSGQLAALAAQQGLGARWGVGFEAVNIAVLIRALEDQQDGVTYEFIRRIVAWARVTGRLVTIPVASDEVEQRYRDRGFERLESNHAYMVYTGYGLRTLSNAERFQMFTFDV